ncbi:MAG TPA: TldD/PmbA family protein [Bacilli bacterium]|nr:TldD/PmbA family protein [Bacilli bacterium]
MITKNQAKEILNAGLAYGADFVELYFEDTINQSIECSGGLIQKSNTAKVSGVGIRVLKEDKEIYGYTNNLNHDHLISLATSLGEGFLGSRITEAKELVAIQKPIHTKIRKHPLLVSSSEKTALVKELYEGAKTYSDEITQVVVNLVDKIQTIWIFNSDGLFATDERTNSRISAQVVASANGIMETATDNFGKNQGYEMFEEINLTEFGRKIAESAVTMLHAPEMVGQVLPVVIHNAFGGVILHEACGHSLEATSVAKNLSVFSNKLGEKIASDIVTAVDDGTIEDAWGSLNIDDEGTPTRRNVLIEHGILKSYLIDKRNARKMKSLSTASARRESYKFSPTSRMTNTFFENGKDTFEDIIKSTKYGLFAKKMGGGSVLPTTGEFNFAVNEGYMIEDGKITHPVRGATLIGSGSDVLLKIDAISDNLSFGHGMCGSLSGSIPANVGQPTIRVSSMTVGGRGGK